MNVLILWGAVIERGVSTQNWLTFRQALGLGASRDFECLVDAGRRGTEQILSQVLTLYIED
jgi:antirestriction protein ArdC